MPNPNWTGRAVTNARAKLRTETPWPIPCPRCGRTIHDTDPWVVGHIIPRDQAPELTHDPGNWRVECRRCSDKSGGYYQAAKRKRNKSASTNRNKAPISFEVEREPPPAVSQYTHTVTPDYTPLSPVFGSTPWISPLIDAIPPGANLPRAMTAPHPRATGSYGPAAVEWVRREMGVQLRWFQQLAMARQLEHDRDGALVWRTVIESTPRRVGKSVRLRCVCCWRVAHPELLGEPQTVLFTGKDLPICKEIHRSSWVWAKQRGWVVRRGMGNEEIEAPDGSRWIVRSQNGVYGYPAGLAACDESWAVPAGVINEGLQPALMDRPSPQLLLTSTAHTKATALMVRRISEALDSLDGSGSSLLLLWAAPDGADPADRTSWRAASPHWDAGREVLVADAWDQVVSGQSVPDPLEPDPVAWFRAQHLNIWPSLARVVGKLWGAEVVERLPRPVQVPVWSGPLVGALESEQSGGRWGVAVSDGAGVECAEVARRSDAVAWLRARSPVRVLAHAAVLRQLPVGDDLDVVAVTLQDAAAATAVLRDHAGGLSWVGPLGDRLPLAGVAVSESGQRLDTGKSAGPVAVVKAVSWALWGAATQQPVAPAVW